jgi:hypothetical protein
VNYRSSRCNICDKSQVLYLVFQLHICQPVSWEQQYNYLILGFEIIHKGSGSSVGITTGYGLDGPGIESRWGRDFSQTSRPALRPTQSPVQWVPGLSRG